MKNREVKLQLTDDRLKVLAHCLNYGENAVSQADERSGKAQKIRNEIAYFRKVLLDHCVTDGKPEHDDFD